MKRLVWLFLALFCTAIAQVQPVDLPVKQQETCDCCESPNACGMPDCAPLPMSAQPNVVVQSPAAQQSEARRLAPVARKQRESFYVRFESRPALMPAFRASSVAAASARAPLFKAHCSFLI